MSIVIENSFVIPAPPDETFAFMSEVERVCPCIPGAELIGRRDDGRYNVRVGMKLGPMMMSYAGSVAITETDPEQRRAALHAQAREQRGNGTAEATMTMNVAPEPAGGSRVTVHSQMLVTGRVAQMGRGIINDVANHMVTDMARAVEQTLQAEKPGIAEQVPTVASQPPRAGRLFWQVVLTRIKRLLFPNASVSGPSGRG